MASRVLLVGHCGVDGPRLQQEIRAFLSDGDVERINSDSDLAAACKEGADLLLINREPVGFEGTDGIGIVRDVCKRFPGQRAMLVSDFPDAQEEAVEAGALPGFGKRDMGSPKLKQCVTAALKEKTNPG